MSVRSRVYRERRLPAGRPLAAIIDGLWRNGEQGVWYDTSDLSTMFQDAAGTLPVYAPGQGQVDPPVGLLLDKRLPRGSEQVTNGDSEAGAIVAPRDSLIRFVSKVQSSDYAFSGNYSTKLTSAAGSGTHYWQLRTVPANTGVIVSGRAYVPVGATAGQPLRIVDQSDGSVLVDVVQTADFGKWAPFSFVRNAKYTSWDLSIGHNVAADWAGGAIYIDSLSIRDLPGNHAYQTTTTSRPTLSARYNLLTATEDLKASVWQKSNSTAPTSSRLVETTTAATHYVSQPYTAASGTPVRFSVRAKPAGRSWIRLTLSLASGGDASSYFDLSTGSKGALGGGSATITPVGDGSYICTVSGTTSSPNPSCGVLLASDNNAQNYTGDGTSGVDVLWSDLRMSSDGVGLPPYQCVFDANTYDTVGFPLYLKFDGVDDWLQTASVDFSGTDKLFATAALRKLSDSAAGAVVELSSVSNTNNGSFALLAPAGPGDTFAVYMRGATALTTSVPSGVPSPASRVFTGVMDTSAAAGRQSRSRLNGAHYAYAYQDAGGGNFGSYPLYIGRRAGTSLSFNGRLYSLVIRGGATPDTTIAKVERYINQKAKVF